MNLKGKFLIARPTVKDPYFKRSVVFVYEHNPQSVIGLIINKKSPNNTVNDIMRNKGYNDIAETPLFVGGPMNQAAVCLLHTPEFASSNTLAVDHRFSVSSDDLMMYKFVNGDIPDGHRFIIGSAMWYPGQMNAELKANHWLISELTAHDVFDYEGREMWDRAVEKNAQQTIDKFF